MLRFLETPPLGRRSEPSLALLVAVTMTGTVAMHIFVPALPAAAADFNASPFAAQLTLTLYLVGLALGQLVYGPLSDALGRRPVILGSLALYLIGFLAAIPAPTIGFLILARVLQSLGGCGSLVIGRAMIRDISTDTDAARKLAVLTTAMTLTPALSPALGGFINAWFGWRAIFVALALTVGTILMIVLLTLPESNRRRIAMPSLATVLRGYGHLLHSAKFRNYLVAGSCGGTSLYAFLAVAPFLIIEVLGRKVEEVGLYCLIVTAGMVIGSIGARQIAGRVEIRHAARRGNLICFVSGLALLVVDLTGQLSLVTLIVPLLVYAIGIGVTAPNAVAGLMNVDPSAAGSASSLYGFSQMAFGATFTLIVSLWHVNSAAPVAVVLVGASALAGIALHRV